MKNKRDENVEKHIYGIIHYDGWHVISKPYQGVIDCGEKDEAWELCKLLSEIEKDIISPQGAF